MAKPSGVCLRSHRFGRVCARGQVEQDRGASLVLRQEDRRLPCPMAVPIGGQQACMSFGRACTLLQYHHWQVHHLFHLAKHCLDAAAPLRGPIALMQTTSAQPKKERHQCSLLQIALPPGNALSRGHRQHAQGDPQPLSHLAMHRL